MSRIELAPQIAIAGLPTTALVAGRPVVVYLELGKDKLDNCQENSIARQAIDASPTLIIDDLEDYS